MELVLDKSIFHLSHVDNKTKVDVVLNIANGKPCVDFICGGEKVYYYVIENFEELSSNDYDLMMYAGAQLLKDKSRWINAKVCEHLSNNIQFYQPSSREMVYTMESDYLYTLNLLYYYRENHFRLTFSNDSNGDVTTCNVEANSLEELQEKVAGYIKVITGMVDVFANNVSSFLDGSFTKYSRV